MKKSTLTRIVHREPHRDQIEAAYVAVSQMKGGSEARDKALVAEVWRIMFDNMPMIRGTGLTENQAAVLEMIAAYIELNKLSPRYQDIADALGWNRMKAHEICRQLAKRKLISMGGGFRALKILKHPDV